MQWSLKVVLIILFIVMNPEKMHKNHLLILLSRIRHHSFKFHASGISWYSAFPFIMGVILLLYCITVLLVFFHSLFVVCINFLFVYNCVYRINFSNIFSNGLCLSLFYALWVFVFQITYCPYTPNVLNLYLYLSIST